jgi:hypothetical protein
MGTSTFFASTGATFGSLSFSGTCPYVSLLAIDQATGDTSEFSPMMAAVPLPTPAVNVSATTLNFGNVGIGSTSPSLSSVMSSTGTADWQIYYIGSPSCYGGPICYGGAEFSCTTTCVSDFQASATKSAPKAYSPGQSCSLTASFSPTFTGPQSTTVQFCGNTSPVTITLTGNGIIPPPITLSPASHDFGPVPVGSSAGPITFTVSNPGATPLSIGAPLSSGPFTLASTTCGLSIAPLGACEVNVTFNPTGPGLAEGQLAILPTSGSPVYATLMGTGTVVAEVLLPSSVEFSYVVGSTSPSVQVVAITNTGLAPLSISSITLTGANFTLDQACPTTLAPGASCQLTLGFSAGEPGEYNGQLAVVTNAPGGSALIGLRGLAQPRPVPIIELSPREIGFGARGFGSLGPPQRVTIRNVGGAPAAFTSFTVSPDFVILNNSCGSSLESLASCETLVAMRPVGFGQRFGTFTVNSNAENSPNSTALFGSGCRLTGLSIGRLGRISSCGP